MTINEKLALARAVYGDKAAVSDESDIVVCRMNEGFLDYYEDFDPLTNANQCHECWDKLVDGFWDIERSGCGYEIWLRKSGTRPRGDVCRDTLLEAMTAAMVQLPLVQELLKEIEG